MATTAPADVTRSPQKIYSECGPVLALNRGKFRDFLTSHYADELIAFPGKHCPVLRDGECFHDVYHIGSMTVVYEKQSRSSGGMVLGLSDDLVAEHHELAVLAAGPAPERDALGSALREYVSRITAR